MKHLASLALCIGLSTCAAKEPVELSQVDAPFVQAFMSTCVRDFHNRQRIEAAAQAMDWKPITDPNIKKMLAPENSSSKWNGWFFSNGGLGIMLALSQSRIEKQRVETCVLASELKAVKLTKQRLTQLLKATYLAKNDAGGQTTEIWRFNFDGEDRLLSFIDAEAMGMNMLNAGVSTNWIKRK